MTDNATPATSPGLWAKLVKIAAGVEYIPKNGRNDFHKYDFATEADVSNGLRKLFAANGVAFLASMESVERKATTYTSNGKEKRNINALCHFRYRLVDADSGEAHEVSWYAEADDSSDKAVNKAATAALKYWLLKSFMVPTGEDPDASSVPHEPRKAAAPNARAKQPPGKPPKIASDPWPEDGPPPDAYDEPAAPAPPGDYEAATGAPVGWQPDFRGDKPPVVGAGNALSCPECGGGIYDNTDDPERGKRPTHKCRDIKGCGWAYWLTTKKGAA
jgi:hypothetical protein